METIFTPERAYGFLPFSFFVVVKFDYPEKILYISTCIRVASYLRTEKMSTRFMEAN